MNNKPTVAISTDFLTCIRSTTKTEAGKSN